MLLLSSCPINHDIEWPCNILAGLSRRAFYPSNDHLDQFFPYHQYESVIQKRFYILVGS